MKNFQQFTMDDTSNIATIGAGTLLGDLTLRLHDAGNRAMAHGTCPQVGAAGHFTIGGLGPMSRQWGSALDHVEEVEVVLANASIVRASAAQNQDILFAVKGAASSFGIVTEFKVATHPEPNQAVQYSYTFDFGDTSSRAQLFKNWQQFISNPDLSRKFASDFVVMEGAVIVSGEYFGPRDEFDELQLSTQLSAGKNNGSIIQLDSCHLRWFKMLRTSLRRLLAELLLGSMPNHCRLRRHLSFPRPESTLYLSIWIRPIREHRHGISYSISKEALSMIRRRTKLHTLIEIICTGCKHIRLIL